MPSYLYLFLYLLWLFTSYYGSRLTMVLYLLCIAGRGQRQRQARLRHGQPLPRTDCAGARRHHRREPVIARRDAPRPHSRVTPVHPGLHPLYIQARVAAVNQVAREEREALSAAADAEGEDELRA